MEETKISFKRCPTCRRINGFCLSAEQIAENEEYACYECQKESKLSKWKESSEKEYLQWQRDVDYAKRKHGLKN